MSETETEGTPAKPRRARRRIVTIALLSLAIAMASAVAFAAWTVNGGGSGYAKAGSAAPLTTSTATPVTSLYPGGTSDLYLVVNNSNPFPVQITAISATASAAVTSSNVGCTGAGTGVSFAGATGLTQLVPASGSVSFTVPGVTMSNASVSACQGATFNLPVTFTADSAA